MGYRVGYLQQGCMEVQIADCGNSYNQTLLQPGELLIY